MGFIFDRLPGNGGVIPREITCHLTAHAALTAGTVYTIDHTFTPSSTNGVALNSAAAADAAAEGTQWVMAMEDIASGAIGKFLIQGYTTILINNGTDIDPGDMLASSATGVVLQAVAGDAIIGIAPVAETGTATPAWFCGTGLGTVHA